MGGSTAEATATTVPAPVTEPEAPPQSELWGAQGRAPWWANLHFVVSWLAGLMAFVLGTVAGGMAMATANPGVFAFAGTAFWCGICWMAAANRLRKDLRWPLVWVLASAVWLGILAMRGFQDLESFHALLEESQPNVVTALRYFAVLGAGLVFGCALRLARKDTHISDGRRPNKSWLAAGAAGFAVLLGLPWVLPNRWHAAAEREVTQLLGRHPAMNEPKVMLGAYMTPLFGEVFRAHHVGLVSQEDIVAACHAEVDAALAAGAKVVFFRATQVGDTPDEVDTKLLVDLAERVRKNGAAVVLIDVPPAHRGADLEQPWKTFLSRHFRRIERLDRQVKPDAYLITSAIYGYHRMGEIVGTYAFKFHHTAWEEHLVLVATELKRTRPERLVGVGLQTWIPEDTEQFMRMLGKDEIDIIGVSCFDTASQASIERQMLSHGHPEQYGQRLWLYGTAYGHPVGGDRTPDLEARWADAMVGWAQRNSVDAVGLSAWGGSVPGGHARMLTQGQLGQRWAEAKGKLSPLGEAFKALSEQASRGWGDERPKYELPDRLPKPKLEPKTEDPDSPEHPKRPGKKDEPAATS